MSRSPAQVFQVCDAPGVFSATDVDDPGFSGFVGAERVVELAVSRRNANWSIAHGGREFDGGHYR